MSDRPLCHCHGEPMLGNGHFRGKQRYVCSVMQRQRLRDLYWNGGKREVMKEHYQARKDSGFCVRCGKPRLSEALCWDCLNEQEAWHALRL